jgi:hypothetical protein
VSIKASNSRSHASGSFSAAMMGYSFCPPDLAERLVYRLTGIFTARLRKPPAALESS